jgi:tetratricopeptide (TPR) repeat protein/O-antigen ligase
MTTTKDLMKYLVYGGIFAIPFIPFIISSSMFFPFIAGKGFTFRIIVEIIFGAYIVLAFIEPVYRPSFNWITKAVLAFTSIIFIADIFGENPYKSIWSNYERMEGFVLIAHLLLFYIVVSSILNTKDLWNKFLNTNIGASMLMTVYGVFQLAGVFKINQGGARVDGTFGNAAYFAIYLVFNIFLSIYMLSDSKIEKWKKWVYSGVILAETIMLYFTATRGAILGFIGGLVVTGILVFWNEKENKTIKNISKYILGSVVVIVLAFLLIKDTNFVKNSPVLSRFSTLSYSEFKTQGRYFVWPMAINGIKERPILGWGQENFNFVFNKNYNPQMFGQEEWFDRTHNVVLDWMIAGGLLGFLAYSSIYLALFYYIWRKQSSLKSSEKSILTGLVVAYIFHNLFVFDNIISYVLFFTVLAMITYENKTEVNTGEFNKKKFSDDSVNYVVLPSAVVLTIALIYFVNVPAISANTKLIKAMTPQKDGVSKNIEYFKQVFDEKSFGDSEAVEQVVTYATQFAGQTSVTEQVRQEIYSLAKEKLEKKISEKPNDARYLVFAGSFYNRFGQYDEAIKHLEKSLMESPKKQTIHFELGSSYLGKRDYQKAFELFKKAYDLKPENKESQILYAIGAIYTSNKQVLDEMSSKISQETILNDNRFLNTYANLGDYNTVINILNVRIGRNPNSRQDRLFLASAYVNMGQKARAISTIEEIIKLDPSFKAEGEFYIQQIQSN